RLGTRYRVLAGTMARPLAREVPVTYPPPAPVPPWPVAPPAPPSARRPGRIVLGLLLVLPALALLGWSYVWPTIWNVQKSFTNARLTGDGSHGVGIANYKALFQGTGFLPAVGYALTLAVVPLLLVAVVAPALAWAAHRTGTAARWVVRVA